MSTHPGTREERLMGSEARSTRGAELVSVPGAGSRLRVLVTRSLSDSWRTILVWGLALGLLGAVYVAMFPSFKTSLGEYLQTMPEGYLQFLGIGASGVVTIEGFLAMEMFNLLAPLSLPFFAILQGARLIAGAEERQSLDLLLSNPISRWQLVVARLLSIGAALVGVLVLTWVLIQVAAVAAGTGLSAGSLALAVLNLLPFCLFFAALALLCSALLHRNAIAITIPSVILVLMYVINGLGGVIESLRPARKASLFYYYGSAIENGINWAGFLGILGCTLVMVVLAVVAFKRRDIYT